MRIFIFIIGLIMLSSACDTATYDNSVINPEEFTTIAKQNLEKDTIVVARDDNQLYQFENDLIITRYALINEDTSKSLPVGDILLLFSIVFIVGLALGMSITY